MKWEIFINTLVQAKTTFNRKNSISLKMIFIIRYQPYKAIILIIKHFF